MTHFTNHPQYSDKQNFQFFKFALTFCNELVSLGFWADYIDPNSGLPVSRVLFKNGTLLSVCDVETFVTTIGMYFCCAESMLTSFAVAVC
jgi:hypothetical protein